MSLLDQIIDEATPRIIRVENDINKISFEADMNASMEKQIANVRSGNWDAAEYGISAEQMVQRILDANTPEKRAAMEKEMRQRAIDRAALDTTGGIVRVMVAVGPNGEKMPWTQLGTMIAHATDSGNAIVLSGLDWNVLKEAATYTHNGVTLKSKTVFLLIRADNGAELGSTGRVYKPIQNKDGFSFMDKVLAEFGAKYETAGSIFGGKKTWMQARLPNSAWDVQGGDPIETFATFMLSHDGTAACRCLPTTVRVVCGNTFRMAAGGKKGISIRHSGNLESKTNQARAALGLSIKKMADFKEASLAMVKKAADPRRFANNVLDKVLDITEEQAKMGADLLAAAQAKTLEEKKKLVEKFQEDINERKDLLNDIIARHDSARCKPHGTVWGSFNSVTENADYYPRRQRGNESDRASRRFESVLTGDADQIKQVAYQEALAYL